MECIVELRNWVIDGSRHNREIDAVRLVSCIDPLLCAYNRFGLMNGDSRSEGTTSSTIYFPIRYLGKVVSYIKMSKG